MTNSLMASHAATRVSLSHVHAVEIAPVTSSHVSCSQLTEDSHASKTAVLIVSHVAARVSLSHSQPSAIAVVIASQICWPSSVLVKNQVSAPTTSVIAPTHGLMKRMTEPNSLPTFIRTGPIFQNALKTVPTTPPSLARIGLADLAIPMILSRHLP